MLITEADLPFCPTNALVLKDLRGLCRVAQLLDTTPQPAMDIHPSAVIAADVQLGESGLSAPMRSSNPAWCWG